MEGARKSVGWSRRSSRPRLEALEERLALSAAPPPLPVSGVLNGWVFRLVSSSGTAAPGPEGGTLSNGYIQAGSISGRAQVAFSQTVNNTANVPAGEGLFVSRSGPKTNAKNLQQPRGPIWQITRTGQPLTGGTFQETIGPAVVNNQGQVAFAARLLTGAALTPTTGIFRYLASQNQSPAQVLPGDALPNGATFAGANSPVSFNNKGAIAFTAVANLAAGRTGINGATVGSGVYVVGQRKSVSNVAAPGDDAPFPIRPNAVAAPKFEYAADPSINDLSQVAFVGRQTGDAASPADPADPNRLLGANLYFVRPGLAPSMVVQQGTTLNAAEGGKTIAYARDPIANNQGRVLFHGAVDGGTNFGVFQYSPTGITKIAQPGDPLPDGGTIASIAVGPGTMGFNDRSDVAFLATSSAGTTGVYLARAGTTYLVAKSGDVIPALGLGSITSFAQTATKTGGPIINADHQILIAARTSTGANSIFAATAFKTINQRASS